MIIVGDIHLNSNNDIKYKQGKLFFEWLEKQEFNCKNETLLLLGDVVEMNVSYECLGYLINKLTSYNFKKIIWVQGNHETLLNDSVLNMFHSFTNIELITDVTLYKDEDLNKTFLMLPHKEITMNGGISIYEEYSNLYKTTINEFDYCVGHITDESQNFGDGKFCDLSKLKVNKYYLGHIHNQTFKNGGRYLGSATKNSSVEDIQKYIVWIKNNEDIIIEVPNFMSYVTIDYGEELKINTPLALVQVNNAPTKFDVEKTYKKDNIGFTKILTKRNNIMNSETVINTVDEDKLFDEFAREKNLSNSVIDICKKVL